MAMTPEEKRIRERERKARQRAANRAKPPLEALPRIGRSKPADGGTRGGTQSGTDGGTDVPSNLSAARDLIESLTVPPTQLYRVALILQLAKDLDVPGAIPQRAGLAARYTENLESLISAARPRERDELDELRRAFYQGRTGGIDNDPEAKRPIRKKA